MSSMDFIYDLTDKLDEQSIEYCLCALRSGNQQDKVDVFYTHNNSYRSYVKLKISRENINIVLNEIKDEKNLKIISKNYKDKNSFKNYLNNLFNL